MPKVYHVRAGKDYPALGIARGDMHYLWSFYRQKPRRSKTQPTRSMLTQNDLLLAVYGVFDGDVPAESSDVQNAIDELESAAQEARDKFENLPEGFQQGDAGQRLESSADAIDTAIQSLETLRSDMEEAEGALEGLSEAAQEAARAAGIYDFSVAERFGECEPEVE